MAYRIEYSGMLLRRVEQLQAESVAAGHGGAFADGLVELHDRLAAEPHTFGELKYHTAMGFPVYSAASGPASISYVVYESQQAVCILKVDRFGG